MKLLKVKCTTRNSGFSLIELIIYMAILAILMTVVMQSFTVTLRRTTTQTSISETKIESSLGLDLLRSEIEHAGFGLPWRFTGNPNPYNEPNPFANGPNVPLALTSADVSGNSLNFSDYLTLRGTNVVRDVTGQKWSHVGRTAPPASTITVPLDQSSDVLLATDNIMVIRPEVGVGHYRELMMVGTNWVTQPTAGALTNYAPAPTPNDPDGIKYLVYGLSEGLTANNFRMPFNRTDYYISNINVPAHCAPGTGVLVKADVNQSADPAPVAPSSADFAVIPIMDCVADFQVAYYLDTNDDGGWNQRVSANGLAGLSAADIRDQVKSVRYYILSHEGNVDTSYTHPNVNIDVDELDDNGNPRNLGRQFNLAGLVGIGANWVNYRWRVDSVAVTPKNLQ